MRVLGIDPGYAIVGWGVVDYAGNRFCLLNTSPIVNALADFGDYYKSVVDRS